MTCIMVATVSHKNKVYYIKGRGNFYYLSSSKRGALNKFPKGFEVKESNGRLWLKKKN